MIKIHIETELELNREWILDEDGETVGETNFVVSEKFARQAFDVLNCQGAFTTEYTDFDEFLDSYEPETDGEAIYQLSLEQGEVIDDIGVVMY